MHHGNHTATMAYCEKDEELDWIKPPNQAGHLETKGLQCQTALPTKTLTIRGQMPLLPACLYNIPNPSLVLE